jgi:hypothetical protein
VLAAAAAPGPKARWGARDLLILPIVILMAVIDTRGLSVTNLVREVVEIAVISALPCALLVRVVVTREDFRRVLVALIVATTMIAALGVFEGLRSWPLYQELAGRFYPPTMPLAQAGVRAGLLRAPGPYNVPIAFGYFLALMALCAISVERVYRDGFSRLPSLGLIVLALLLTQSRGGWLGFLVGFAALLFYRRKVGSMLAITVPIIFIGLLIRVVGVGDGRLAESLGQTGHSVETAEYRTILFDRGMQEFWNRPIVGRAESEVMAAMIDMTQGEGIIDFVNTYLWLAVMTGTAGVVAFGAVAISAVANTLPRPNRQDPSFGMDGFIFAAIIASAVMLTFGSFFNIVRLSFLLLIAFSCIVARQRAVEKRERLRQRAAPPAAAPLPTPSRPAAAGLA